MTCTREPPVIDPDGSLDDDEFLFADEDGEEAAEAAPAPPAGPPWKVLIVDDDREVHEVTRFALRGLTHSGRPVSFLDAYSGEEGGRILQANPDIALILLDVVMERDDAGLQLARRIREDIGNPFVRIILRTGQPGQAPERAVVVQYDINDYKAKDELTAQRLYTAVVTALRAYEQIQVMEMNRQGLQRILEASAGLFEERSVERFVEGVVLQMRALMGGASGVLLCVVGQDDGDTVVEPRLLAGVAPFPVRKGPLDAGLPPDIRQRILATLVNGESRFETDWAAVHFHVSRRLSSVIYVHGLDRPLGLDRTLVELFARTVAIGFDNVLLFEELVQDRSHDRPTGLLNRNGFVAAINAALASLAAGGMAGCAVATIDLRRFRDINQELGVAWGDRLLVATADRLMQAAGHGMACARIGGDQFAILLPDCTQDQARDRVKEIAAGLGAAVMLAGREVHPMAIPGLAWCGIAGTHAEELLARAEEAMQRAKRTFGRLSEIVIGQQEPPGRLGLTIELNAAVRQNQFELYYQPIVAAADRKVVAFEALLRWNHPLRGIVAPATFIPTAEETGLIVPIGSWALGQAARQAVLWQRESRDPVWISVNVSAAQLSEPGFLDQVRQVVTETGVDPTFLKVEVTESTIITDPDHAASVLNGLRDLGIRLCMDDFGTGYSNLSYLQTLPFDFLKIDRAFVKSMLDRYESRTILRTMLALAQQLDLEVVAEGVETSAQADELQRLGCGFLQGFLFGRPMPASLAGALIGG